MDDLLYFPTLRSSDLTCQRIPLTPLERGGECAQHIFSGERLLQQRDDAEFGGASRRVGVGNPDRKSTRLNSSHLVISYAVFCLKKKNICLGVTFMIFY